MNPLSLFTTMLNPANLAMLSMGPAGIALMAAKSIMMQFGEQLLQMIGEELGLPQGLIDMAKTAFRAEMGVAPGQNDFANMQDAFQAFGQAVGASPFETAQAEGDLNTLLGNAANEMSQRGRDAMRGGGAKSWIMAIAIAMGKQIDKKAAEMTKMADKITDKTPSLTAKFSAASQEFGIMMNALTTVIKTAGEAMSNTARKQ
jgi:hypothetical protein